METNEIIQQAHNLIIKKSDDFGYSDLIICGENIKNINGKWVLEAEISYTWYLNGWAEPVKKEKIIGVYKDNVWLIPNFHCEQ